MNDMLKDLMKVAENDYATLVEDGIVGDITGWVSTGSYALNALLSGSIYNGLPNNKIVALAGDPGTGKTFYAINIIKQFLIDNPKGFCFYFESETALTKDMFKERGLDPARVVFVPVSTIQEFRTQAVKILDRYMETKKDRPPMIFVLDSLGNLSTAKEMEDITAGKDTRDMTRAQLIKGAFRVLTLKLSKAEVPLLLTNHVYDVVGSYVPMKKMSGGSGLEYAASIIVFLSKQKDKDKDGNVTGAIINAIIKKGRLTRENKKVSTLLDYETGLDPYYGLLDLADKFGVLKRLSTKPIKYQMPDGTEVKESDLLNKPEKHFTPEILDLIDAQCKKEFVYSKTEEKELENDTE